MKQKKNQCPPNRENGTGENGRKHLKGNHPYQKILDTHLR